jgi:inactivated superfamily I helicase
MDNYQIACEINEVLISFVSHGYEGNNVSERILRRLMKNLGYVPTDGLPVEIDVIEKHGPCKYNRI